MSPARPHPTATLTAVLNSVNSASSSRPLPGLDLATAALLMLNGDLFHLTLPLG